MAYRLWQLFLLPKTVNFPLKSNNDLMDDFPLCAFLLHIIELLIILKTPLGGIYE